MPALATASDFSDFSGPNAPRSGVVLAVMMRRFTVQIHGWTPELCDGDEGTVGRHRRSAEYANDSSMGYEEPKSP